MRRAVPAALAAAGVLLTGCDAAGQVCPAVFYGSTLVVRLAADWPPGPDRTLQVDCDSPCVPPFLAGTEQPPGSTAASTSAPVPVDAGEARVVLVSRPDSVVVTLSDPNGSLTSVEEEPTWKRVGGSEECGGPMEATVTVPAP